VGQEFLNFLTFEDGTDRLSRNVCKELPHYAGIIPEKREFIKKVIEAKTETWVSSVLIGNSAQIYRQHLALPSTKTTGMVR
jgi:hypothetical protein